MRYSKFNCCQAIVAVTTLSWAGTVLVADDSASFAIFEAYYKAQVERDKIWERQAARRLDMVQAAIDKAEQEKLRAGVERDDLRLQTERLRVKHQMYRLMNENLALENDRQGYDIARVKGKYAQRRAEVRDIFRDKYLNMPEESRAETWSGRALNYFLAACSAAAVNQEILAKRIGQEREVETQKLKRIIDEVERDGSASDLLLEIDSLGMLPVNQYEAALDHPDLSTANKQGLQDAQESVRSCLDRLDLLSQLGSQSELAAHDIGNLVFTKGGRRKLRIGAKSDEVLPLDWPVLILKTKEYKNLTAKIDEIKQSAVTALQSGEDVPFDARIKLAELEAEFRKRVKQDYGKWVREFRGKRNLLDMAMQAHKFADHLRMQLGYLNQVDSIDDLTTGSTSHITNATQLLAHMSRNGLKFAEADDMGSASYEVVLQALRNYYLDLKSFQYLSQFELENQLADLDTYARREEESFQREFRNSDEIFERVMKANQPENQGVLSFQLNTESNELSQAMSNFNMPTAEVN